MKIKTVVISVTVSAALVAGAGYGAYYAWQGNKSPVEVVPVSNVNNSYWGESTSIYGSVTAQISQTVELNDEYNVEEIYVKEGDEVKEGDPLFSYDMTLPELELEMEQLSLQTQELTMTKLERDLEKLKGTTATASLEMNTLAMTTSSAEDTVIDESDGAGSQDGSDSDGDEAGASSGEGAASSGESGEESSQDTSLSGSIEVENMEEVASAEGATEEELAIVERVVSYERLALAVDTLFRAYGDTLRAEEVRSALEESSAYYRKYLADEQITLEEKENGTETEVRTYVLKDSVRAALGEEEAAKLETVRSQMDDYQTACVEMMIREGAQQAETDPSGLADALEEIRTSYELLDTAQQASVENAEVWSELQVLAQQLADAPQSVSEGTDDSAAVDPQAESGTDESETAAQSETGTDKPDAAAQTETDTDKPDAAVQPETGMDESETAAQTETTVTETQESESAEQINTHINTFVSMAETVLADGAKTSLEAEGKDYATEIETAIVFYQQWLSELPEEILSGASATAKMNQYQLRQDIEQQLKASDRSVLAQELQDDYQKICIRYVRALFDVLDPDALVRTKLEKADQAYADLGEDWTTILEQQWQEEQTAQTEDGTLSEGTDETDGQTQSLSSGSIGDLLAVYKVYLLLQEYLQLDLNTTSDDVRSAAIEQIYQAYAGLTDTQKLLAGQNADLISLLSQNGLWNESESESETDDWEDYYGDSYGGDYDGVGYTASELQELIESKEREIKDCALDIREIELSVQQKQRVVDGKIVKSTLDGTVVSIGTLEGDSDDDYFVKVTNQTGLYAKGSMNELALESIHVGDRISGMMTDTGVSFTAVIKEIQEYPDPDGNSSWGWTTENTNASYYPFYAQIEDTDGIEEGEAEIQLSDTLSMAGDTIYLEKYFVRTESDGKSYVYIQGPNGKLKKQYVKTGKTLYSWVIEIVSGLELTDKIAFPYGSNVQEGAQTKEVDMLEDAYM
jgi:hypothetical protein